MTKELPCPAHGTLDCNCEAGREQRVRINADVPASEPKSAYDKALDEFRASHEYKSVVMQQPSDAYVAAVEKMTPEEKMRFISAAPPPTFTHVALTPRGPELGGYVKVGSFVERPVSKEQDRDERSRWISSNHQTHKREPIMWNENEDGPGVVSTEYDIQKAIEMIAALTRNLLSLGDGDIDVHVLPRNREYLVTVEVQGFALRKGHKRLSVALENMLAELASRVSKRIEEAQVLLKTVGPDA